MAILSCLDHWAHLKMHILAFILPPNSSFSIQEPESSLNDLNWVTFLWRPSFGTHCTQDRNKHVSHAYKGFMGCLASPHLAHSALGALLCSHTVFFLPQSLCTSVLCVWDTPPWLLHVHYVSPERCPTAGTPQSHCLISLCLIPLQNLPIFRLHWLLIYIYFHLIHASSSSDESCGLLEDRNITLLIDL